MVNNHGLMNDKRLYVLRFAFYVLCMTFAPCILQAQEVLLPLQTRGEWKVERDERSAKDGAVRLPFFDDFSDYCGTPDPTLWEGANGYVNYGHGPLPPTVGVLTLDALDADGQLYEAASVDLFNADTVSSQPIRLDSLSAADSVVLSFYYLPGGGSGNMWERTGDEPDLLDSLILDFYDGQQWTTVWGRGGISVDTLIAHTGRDWQYVAIPIIDSAYLQNEFRFRFRNLCSLENNRKTGMTGNCDIWNIDYVTIDTNRSLSEVPVFRDIAFVEAAPSMLSHYQAMPARQYTADEMAENIRMTITNLYSSDLASQYGYCIVDATGDTVYRYDGGFENAPAFLPDGTYQSVAAHASPRVGYTFAPMDDPTDYTIIHTVREGVGGDNHQQNDTVRFVQHFVDYYAYDDGTAENGYGLTSTASHVYLAYRFDLNVADTLTAVAMYFNRTKNGENEYTPFNLTVWQNEDGKPGTILYRDEVRRFPEFNGLNKYHRYALEEPVVVEGSIFVGFDQGNNNYINLGFDRKHNSSDRIYYRTGTDWQESILSGSLMIRPYFGMAATVGVESGEWSMENLRAYPNPANEHVTIDRLPEGSTVQLYDLMGRLLQSSQENILRVASLPNGVYLMRVLPKDGRHVVSSKLVIKH